MNHKIFILFVLFFFQIIRAFNSDNFMYHIIEPIHPIASFYTNASFFYVQNDHFFNQCGKKQEISEFFFGCDLRLKDIYLASQLAADGYFTLPGNPPFGGIPAEQFIACLSMTKFDFTYTEMIQKIILQYDYRFPLDKKGVSFVIGCTIPLVNHHRIIDYKISDGLLACTIPSSGNIDTIKQFFMNYNDINTFFEKEVLAPKKICLIPRQHRAGVGDCIVDIRLEMVQKRRWTKSLGCFIVLPFCGHKARGNILWEIETTQGGIETGAYLCLGYGSPYNMINLYGRVDFGIEWSFNRCMRIPQIKKSKNDLFYPSLFSMHLVDPFERFDSSIYQFADNTFLVKEKYKAKGAITLGNIWYNIFYQSVGLMTEYSFNFSDGQRYAFIDKKKCGALYDIYAPYCTTFRQKHECMIGFLFDTNHGDLKFSCAFRAVITGKNIPISRSFEIGFSASF